MALPIFLVAPVMRSWLVIIGRRFRCYSAYKSLA